jgi:micrococcal nuclease
MIFRQANSPVKYSVIFILSFIAFLYCDTEKKTAKEQSTDKPVASDSVIAVIDGDTFILNGNRTVRLAMIDTPEENEPLYDEAAHHLARLILNKRVKLNPVGAGVDHYGRMLANVMIDTINIGRRMLHDGMGVLYLFDDNAYLKDVYLQSQIAAIDNKVGIWSLPEPMPEKFYINLKGSYRFHRPLCHHLKKSNPDKIIRIESRNAALRQGLAPCRTCKP